MTYAKEPYTYFQPGDIIFQINGERAAAAGAQSAAVGSQEPRSSELGSTSSEATGFPSESSDIKPPAENPVYEGEGGDKLSFEEKVEVLRKWSQSVADDLGLHITIQPNKNREVYFPGMPDDQIFFKAGLKAAKLETEILPDETVAGEASSSTRQAYTSPAVSAPAAFSLVVVEVKQNSQSEEQNPEGYLPHKDLAKLIAALDDDRRAAVLTGSGIELGVVTPNWLVGPASEWGGGGGPGSRPEPYDGRPGLAAYEFDLPPALEKHCSSDKTQRGADIKIAILDTAPSMHDLVWAYERYHKVNYRRHIEHHYLIESLLKPGGQLHVHHASREDLFRMRAVHLRDHNYNMSAHGLFVAGIIHSIVPAAEIHLYEVLNSEGVGDFLTIYNALAKVAQEFRGQRLVVNCSLTLSIPLGGKDTQPTDSSRVIGFANSLPIVGHRLTDMYPDFLNKLVSQDLAKRACSWIQSICDTIYLSNSRVIAAAGNDWVQGEDPGRPHARALASFESVQGVGAVPRVQPATATIPNGRYEVSSYSDLSDEPSGEGIVTLGGEPGEGRGILGVYVGEFPPPLELSFWQKIVWFITRLLGDQYTGAPENKNDWAWWAGTSFATPILTGCIAAVLGKSRALASTEEAIRLMYACGAIENHRTHYGEDLLDVTQG